VIVPDIHAGPGKMNDFNSMLHSVQVHYVMMSVIIHVGNCFPCFALLSVLIESPVGMSGRQFLVVWVPRRCKNGIKYNIQVIHNKYWGVCPNIKSSDTMLLQTEFHDIHLCKIARILPPDYDIHWSNAICINISCGFLSSNGRMTSSVLTWRRQHGSDSITPHSDNL